MVVIPIYDIHTSRMFQFSLLCYFVICICLSRGLAHNSHAQTRLNGAESGGTNADRYYALSESQPSSEQSSHAVKPQWNVRTPKERDGDNDPFKDGNPRNHTLLPFVFEPLPLGSIKPRGWLLQQMQLMADGLPGHEHDFYHLVKDAPWLGGDHEYSPLNEAFPYWYNGIVPLAYGLDDERLKAHVLRVTDWIIQHQQEDGWLGPEDSLSRRNFWGRYPLFLGLMQLVEAEPKVRESGMVIRAMHNFVNLMHEMLSNDYEGYVWRPGDNFDEQWGRSRAADMMISLQWMYEKYPMDNHQRIHDCLRFMYEMAFDWSYWFSEEIYIKEDLDTYPVQFTDLLFPYLHGVNAGQGLKSGAVMRRLTHDDTLLNSTRNGVDWTFRYHGTPSGAVIGDERQAGMSPLRGTELCSVVETMYSLSYLYQSLGDKDFADRAELTAYNALPVMVMPNWWAHQYIAQTNQPVSHELEQAPFWNVGSWGQTFGTEPNYPCCTVDFPQSYPKFVSASFVKEGKNGIAHALLGPGEVQVTLQRNKIRIRCETNYPFSHYLEYDVKARYRFPFSFRVPSWAVLDESSVWINDEDELDFEPDPLTGMHTVTIEPGHTKLRVKFGANIRIEHRANDTISIHHGSLLYAVSITGEYHKSRPARYPGDDAPEEAGDWSILPQTPWNLAIDPTSLRFFQYPNRYDKHLPNPIWDENAPPVAISALACEINWNLTHGYAPNPPQKGERNCTGRAFPIELKPYGSAKLHMAELPIVDLRPGSPDLWDPFKGDGSEAIELKPKV